MKKNLFLYLAALVSCLLSCSEQVDAPKVDGMMLIRLGSARVDASLSSRAPLSGVDRPLTVLVPSAVPVSGSNPSLTNSGYVDGLHALGTMTFSGNSVPVSYDLASLGDDADIKSAFPASNQVCLFGLYPADTNLWSFTNTTVSATFTGKDDVMCAPELLIKASDVEVGSYQSLDFKHLLTRLEVKLKAKDIDAISSVGSIKSIRLVADASGGGKIKDQLTFTPEIGTVVFTESEATTALPFYQVTTNSYTDDAYINQSYTLTTSAVLQAYSLVAPATADASNENEYFLAVERGDGHVDYVGFDLLKSNNLTPFVGSTAGWVFTVTLTYSKEYIETVEAVVSGTIGSQDWTDYDQSVVIEN